MANPHGHFGAGRLYPSNRPGGSVIEHHDHGKHQNFPSANQVGRIRDDEPKDYTKTGLPASSDRPPKATSPNVPVINLPSTHIHFSHLVAGPCPLQSPNPPLNPFHPALRIRHKRPIAHDPRLVPLPDQRLAPRPQRRDLGRLRELRRLQALGPRQEGDELRGQRGVRDGGIGGDGRQRGDGRGERGGKGEHGGAQGGGVELCRGLRVGGRGRREEAGVGAVCFKGREQKVSVLLAGFVGRKEIVREGWAYRA